MSTHFIQLSVGDSIVKMTPYIIQTAVFLLKKIEFKV